MGRNLRFKQDSIEEDEAVQSVVEELGVQSSVSVKSHGLEKVIDCAKELGIDTGDFKSILRYDWSRSREFTLTMEEIQKLHSFCRETIAAIEETYDVEDYTRRISDGLYDEERKTDKTRCLEAWGKLKPMEQICRKALELEVELEVL